MNGSGIIRIEVPNMFSMLQLGHGKFEVIRGQGFSSDEVEIQTKLALCLIIQTMYETLY